MKRAKLILTTAIFGSLLVAFSLSHTATGKAEFGTSAPIKVAEDAHFG
ncbi:hypothetical protein ACSYGW_07060 [Bacillus glycinifermentans]